MDLRRRPFPALASAFTVPREARRASPATTRMRDARMCENSGTVAATCLSRERTAWFKLGRLSATRVEILSEKRLRKPSQIAKRDAGSAEVDNGGCAVCLFGNGRQLQDRVKPGCCQGSDDHLA